VIILGLLFEKEEELNIAKKSNSGIVQNQVNTFQWNYIDGFYKNGFEDIIIINALPVGTFPKHYKKMIIESKNWVYGNHKHFQLGDINLPFIKQEGRYRECKKIVNNLRDKEILIYSAYLPFLRAVYRLDSSYKITLIVPDLPAYYDYNQTNRIGAFLRKLNNILITKYIERVDRFILLTETMKEQLNVGERPYLVMEGICTEKTPQYNFNKNSFKKIILYTGSLNKKFGISTLIDAFKLIPNDNYELWICGGGDYQDSILLETKRDKRIKFYGYVSKDTVEKLQSQANALVNPRKNDDEYTKYSFPSKLMEYLLSNVPVVAYKLDGVPEEYDSYIYYVKDDSPESLSNALLTVCEDEDGRYKKMAYKASQYMENEKSAIKQAQRIIEFIGLQK